MWTQHGSFMTILLEKMHEQIFNQNLPLSRIRSDMDMVPADICTLRDQGSRTNSPMPRPRLSASSHHHHQQDQARNLSIFFPFSFWILRAIWQHRSRNVPMVLKSSVVQP